MNLRKGLWRKPLGPRRRLMRTLSRVRLTFRRKMSPRPRRRFEIQPAKFRGVSLPCRTTDYGKKDYPSMTNCSTNKENKASPDSQRKRET